MHSNVNKELETLMCAMVNPEINDTLIFILNPLKHEKKALPIHLHTTDTHLRLIRAQIEDFRLTMKDN